MKNFRDYEDLIRSTVKEMDSKDTNYTWSIHSFSKTRVTLTWSYLDKNDGKFCITILEPIDTSDGERFITSRTPLDDMINGHIAHETPTKCWQESYENSITRSLQECYNYAHKYY